MTWCVTFLWLTEKEEILLDKVVCYILVVN